MSYRYERYQPPRRRKYGCLTALVVFVWLLLILLIVYRFLWRDQVSQYVGEQIGQRISGPAQPGLGQQIEEGAQENLPDAVAALPSGSITITEQQANAFLATRASTQPPIDSITVRFVPGQVEADVVALGTTSTVQMGLAVQNGRIIVLNPTINGLLGQAISAEDVTRSLENQINAQLEAQGRRITDLQINQGEVVVTVE